jgi:hypothetical protein
MEISPLRYLRVRSTEGCGHRRWTAVTILPPFPARRPRMAVLRALALVLAAGGLGGAAPAHAFGVSLKTSINALLPGGQSNSELALDRVRGAGAQFVKLAIDWYTIAPAHPPSGFNPANPEDPAYRWGDLDEAIREAVARGLTPVIDFSKPPGWADSPPGAGWEYPNPEQVALFAHALAARYDGSRPGLPWVRYWEAWNEPNVSYFLQPQLRNGQPVSVSTYRTIVDDFSAAVHGARADDVVIGGELFPNGFRHSEATAIAPLEFTRRLFCLSGGAFPHRVCRTEVHVDAWSVHPYTTGGPSTLPANPNNVWIYNLGALVSLVHAAQHLGALVSAHPAQVWVSEFSWDSNPPNSHAAPLGLLQRWVPEALYRSWLAGISVFTWFTLDDDPTASPPLNSGLYFACSEGIACEKPKPILAAFRFPFVAFKLSRHRALVWGRTPGGMPERVQVQWQQGTQWHGLTTLAADGDGIFTAPIALPPAANPQNAYLRVVRAGGEASPAFSLHHPPDIIVPPFGS